MHQYTPRKPSELIILLTTLVFITAEVAKFGFLLGYCPNHQFLSE
jgi:hypothetical protein